MKPTPHFYTALALLALVSSARAVNVPGDGSDGVFSPNASVTIDLAQAVTSDWDANNSANAGKGIYDAAKWAVVFKFASVDIPAGVTVTFTNHPSHAPVVWLVSGNVSISGTVNLDGKNPTNDTILALTPTEPGPGGFRGGPAGVSRAGAGYGPGWGGNAAYASVYGNPQILPLIGGSGGQGGGGHTGGAGGGALLIAAPSLITISGQIQANGGTHINFTGNGAGSGGAVRLISDQVLGNGSIQATNYGGHNILGRIRVEASTLAPTLNFTPSTIAVPPTANAVIWPAETAPTVKILSVDAIAAPADPLAPLISTSDITLQTNGAVQVLLETRNFPVSGVVQFKTNEKFGNASGWITATYAGGGQSIATWSASFTPAGGFTTLQARATVP